MKTIQNPNQWKLSIALIPVPVLLVYVVVTRSFPSWIWIVFALSTALYMGLLTYYCIKQKCYTQLIRNYIALILWVVTFIATSRIG